jgi:hypothetical protein
MNTAAARRIALATLVAPVEMMTGWPQMKRSETPVVVPCQRAVI